MYLLLHQTYLNLFPIVCCYYSAAGGGASLLSTDPYPANVALDNISVTAPHLARDALVEKLHDMILQTPLVHISAPMGSGKTSILNLLAHKYRSKFDCAVVGLRAMEPVAALASLGVLYETRQLTPELKGLCDHHMVVLMLDDCHARYSPEYADFWTEFVKGSPGWLPPRLRIVFCATRSLTTAPDSPAVFGQLASLNRVDFMLTAEESLQFLSLNPPTGMSQCLSPHAVALDVVVRECNGLVAALRICTDFLNSNFSQFVVGNIQQVSTEGILNAVFSSLLAARVGERCFAARSENVPAPLRRFLVDMMTRPVGGAAMASEDNAAFVHLLRTGMVVEFGGSVEFSSPLAMRFASALLFPTRATPGTKPLDLRTLVVDAFALMSASGLVNSVSDSAQDRPKETVYQHFLMQNLFQLTPPVSSICPELSRVFPEPGGATTGDSIAGEVDFFINGELRWGIELLIDGAGVGEHIRRFSPGGKYSPLCARDYVVVDIRRGAVTNVATHEKRMTVFFSDEFKSFKYKHGTGKGVQTVNLKA